MGFGFSLFFVFILAPLTGILLLTWALTKKRIFGITVGLIWILLFGLVILAESINAVNSKVKLDKNDYYGQYIINRDYFPGKQADWQYDNFRFEIKDNDSIYFYVTDKEKILDTYRGRITTVKPYSSERLVINMDQPNHHILITNPTIYRYTWDFDLIFYSPNFNNVCFKKGEWK